MKRRIALVLAVTLVTALAAVAKEEAHHAPAPPADARFDFLKGLAGSWTAAAAEAGGPPHTVEFRVTAGGHAVEEREFAGTPMEMVTLYHIEGRDLVANHYCMIGNRPKLKAAEKVVDGALTLACAGTPGGAASHAAEHVHGWSIRLGADGRLHYDAQLVKHGEVTTAPSLVLTRQAATASR